MKIDFALQRCKYFQLFFVAVRSKKASRPGSGWGSTEFSEDAATARDSTVLSDDIAAGRGLKQGFLTALERAGALPLLLPSGSA